MISAMLIEDEFLARVGLRTCIPWNAEGYDIVAEAEDGESAIQLYEKYKPRLVITDIRLPHMNGIDVMKHIREKDKAVRFIIISAYDDFKIAQEAIGIGVEGYFVKGSINTEELVFELRRLKNKFSIENEPISQIIQKPTSLAEICILGRKFKNPKDYLGINIKQGKLYLLVFHVTNTNLDSLAEIIHSFMDSRGISNCFGKEKNNVWFFISEDRQYIMEMVHEISSMFRMYIQENVNIGVSRNFYEEGDIRTTVYEGLLSANYKIGYKDICCEVYKEECDSYEKENESIRRFDESLRCKRFENARQEISNLENMLQSSYSVKGLKKTVFKLVGILCDQGVEKSEIALYNELLDIMDIREIFRRVADEVQRIEMNTSVSSEENAYIQKAIGYIYENYSLPLNVKKAADYVHISSNYLGRIFVRSTGQHLTYFINRVRMEKSRDLLMEHKYNMNEIAEKVGIFDQRYFSKLFKKYYGMSPKEYAGKRNRIAD